MNDQPELTPDHPDQFHLGVLTAMATTARERHVELIAQLDSTNLKIDRLQDDVDLIRTGELMNIRARISDGLAGASAETQALRAWLKEVNGRPHPTNQELAELSRLTIVRSQTERSEASNSAYRKRVPWLILVGFAIALAAWLLDNLGHVVTVH